MKVEFSGLPVVLFITFMVLKLMHVITWPWLWVLAPLWGPLVILCVIVFIVIAVRISMEIVDS